MSEKQIDVLAVMEREARCLAAHNPREADEMLTTRKYVAELIDAAAGIESLARLAATPLHNYRSAVDRLTDALARVRSS